ncbi:MAG: hypothetical protein WAV29_05590, partial [Microgenomates group bacterium]
MKKLSLLFFGALVLLAIFLFGPNVKESRAVNSCMDPNADPPYTCAGDDIRCNCGCKWITGTKPETCDSICA